MASRDIANIPVISLQDKNAARGLLEAGIQHGFIFIQQEGLELRSSQVEDMFALSRKLFAAPEDVKATCSIHSSESGKNHGWLGMHRETLDPAHQKKGDFKEAFNVGEFFHGEPQQPFPAPLQDHIEEIDTFFSRCHALCNQILRLLAQALEIPDEQGGREWFARRHDPTKGPSGSILRLLYYPSLPASTAIDPSEDIRAGAHSDYGSITLLFRLPGQPGLEIMTSEGNWAAVPLHPNGADHNNKLPILVNIGDLLSYWTSGMLRSTVHRVIFPSAEDLEDRYSIAYFCHPEDEAQLVEIPSNIVQDFCREGPHVVSANPRVLTARDHLNSRLAATYGI